MATRAKGTIPKQQESDEWETVGGSLGQEHDFRGGPLVGFYLGAQTVATRKVESGEATAHRFADINDPESIIFVWESADLRSAFTGTDAIALGDKVRIAFLGEREFTSDDGQPRRIKQYRVQRSKA